MPKDICLVWYAMASESAVHFFHSGMKRSRSRGNLDIVLRIWKYSFSSFIRIPRVWWMIAAFVYWQQPQKKLYFNRNFQKKDSGIRTLKFTNDCLATSFFCLKVKCRELVLLWIISSGFDAGTSPGDGQLYCHLHGRAQCRAICMGGHSIVPSAWVGTESCHLHGRAQSRAICMGGHSVVPSDGRKSVRNNVLKNEEKYWQLINNKPLTICTTDFIASWWKQLQVPKYTTKYTNIYNMNPLNRRLNWRFCALTYFSKHFSRSVKFLKPKNKKDTSQCCQLNQPVCNSL